MEINWLQEAQKRKEMLLEDLSELLRINSVRDIEHQTDEYPLGAGPALALKKVLPTSSCFKLYSSISC